MSGIQAYHFAQFRESGFLSFYQRVRACGGVVCFDFEDSISHDNPARARVLKQQQRRAIVEQLLALAPELDFRYLGLRINAVGTADYQADLAALAQLPALGCVFLPKAEHPGQLQQLLQELPRPVENVIPVLETAGAFANAEALLALPDPRLALVAFGHCDFNLSCGHAPFHHHDSPRYWAWLDFLDRHCHRAGKRLLNSPMLQLDDAPAYRAMLTRLQAYPSIGGQITLSLAQTQLCAAARAEAGPLPALADSRLDAARWARRVVQDFAAHRRPRTAFAVDAARALISPHELRAARHHLQA
ncbi:aldolase/citrate lyase family protein [Hymenobacter persicinus]|uniref:Uncharacterized protein n=1 Tax=Hymenobacter persicinus TaxID=2025506 RepID=A0A4Q5L8V8_9BACT|nr:aldolase/citrate lyase family protein [Hymenobacter persicinus]RYU78142.1 hypothetical protein EWM57_14970 [Hymenobacter persicinus]